MRLEFDPEALEDILYWIRENRKIAEKIIVLAKEIQKTPYSGSGKPETLRFNFLLVKKNHG